MNQPAYQSNTVPANPLEVHRPLFADELARVDGLIAGLGEGQVPLIPQIIQHILLAGGKRLRPILTILAAKLCGYSEGERHVNMAACVELLHTATLLHDDVVDKSALRRGVETAHEVFGNEASVLVGDFLLSQSFHIMAQDTLEVLRILADASVTITRGEVKQLSAMNHVATSEADYREIICAKTATLFAAATEIGATLAEVSPEQREAMRCFGNDLGMAFQLVDDALDYSARQEQLGKAVGDDLREGKMTFPVIEAYRRGTPAEQQFWQRVIETPESQTEADFAEATGYIARHDALEATVEAARAHVAAASAHLSSLPDQPEKQALLDLAQFTISRPY